ncbi:MAG TPA: hypothetical protein VG994_12950 [Steroidobacteraceae bacterium]|nr:hypothetical protein [Steroidobacteraceae bacterium]
MNPGTTIATLDDSSLIKVDFAVPENLLSVLREGLKVPDAAAADPAAPDPAAASRALSARGAAP